MKIVFVQPPNMQRKGKWKKQNVYRTPTNLAILDSYIINEGHEAIVYDLDIEGGTLDEMASLVMKENPSFVGFSCLTPRFPIILDIAYQCKKIDPYVKIVLGGPHVSGQPERALMDNNIIDYVLVGESEEALHELLLCIENNKSIKSIKNLVFRQKSKIVKNPVRPYINDLDSLPFPAWDLLKLDKYIDPAFYQGPHVGIITARGCPFNCNFCASNVIWGRKVRFRSASNVVNELETVCKKFDIHEFMFYDDTFTINRQRVIEICNEILKRRLNIRFYAQVRVDTIDLELVKLLKDAGCFGVAIGVESGNESILKDMGKSITKNDIRQGCDVLQKAKMPFLASYIIGHPGDTHETIQETIDFSIELNADQSKYLIATPYPGTKLYNMAVSQGIITEKGAENLGDHTYFQHVAANLSKVSDKDLLNYQQKAFDDYDKIKRPMC